MNILVYSGPEVISASLAQSLTSLRTLLLPNYTVQAVTSQSLANHPWGAACALLVFPSCLSAPSSPKVTEAVNNFVNAGGAYLGLSSGAKFAGRVTMPDGQLRFDDKRTATSIYPTFRSNSEATTATLRSRADGNTEWRVNQDGSSSFIDIPDSPHVSVLARYSNGGVAGISYLSPGGLKLAIWSPSLEYTLAETPLSPDELRESEQLRLALLRDTLRSLGLHLPEDRPPNCPLPQFLVAPPSRSDIVPHILSALQLEVPSDGTAPAILSDANDTFHFHSYSNGVTALQQARVTSLETSQLMKEEEWQPKHVVVCSTEQRPTSEHTPLFDVDRYFGSLHSARKQEGLDERERDSWGMGEALLYGEVVSSTQTMLDKNPRLLHGLPTPILSLAAIQLSGRGRGGNTWLSPRGSLPISLLLRIPFSQVPPAKLVFVQYLFSLAVTEAVRDEKVLGPKYGESVRIKWPNDLYVVDAEGRKKVGGILVNTSFGTGGVEAVIGSGLNVTNALPTTSIAQLLPSSSHRKLSMEDTAAVILAKFEAMWKTFVAHGGSFEPFLDLYLERWLHSDQSVTVTSVSPSQVVRICGITLDHGLLRTIPERSGTGEIGGMRAGGGMAYIDLQPDGNSFDLMAGLIKTKTYG
ncbi:class II aaRS and biotin synthetase [Heliocybe sulcata]|uniref:Class II aaRS and biotin synthetase n=1 Tax=Heliocybe sulcata TaxID=5364 RepID=A0A5C3N9P6_9AGAM|nr:class II aaRS and biotin synthetase [Heliocybe sulcata]